MTMKNANDLCTVCGTQRRRLPTPENLICISCGNAHQSHIKCPEGHALCSACESREAMKRIADIAMSTSSKDPQRIAEIMMSHLNLPLLGCEHAPLAAGALMASLKNSPYGKEKISDKDIREVFERAAKQTADGSCASTGVCGIVPAIGACFSLFLGARRGSDTEQKITMEAAIRASQSIADLAGPSCCKANVRAALSASVELLGERFGITLPVKDSAIICHDSERHLQGCREEKCPYFLKPTRDIFAEGKFVPGTVCIS